MKRCSAPLIIKKSKHNELSLHTHWNGYCLKKEERNVSEDVGKMETLHNC
jgi:hypothetical protein